MRKIIFTFVLAILFIGMVSAFDFDDDLSYNKFENKYTITNWLGLGETIAELKLNTPQYHQVGLGYQKVAEIEIRNGGFDYEKIIKGIELYDITKGMKEINRDVDYKIATTVEVPKYKTVCDVKKYVNNSEYNDCYQIQDGTRQVEKWVDFTKNSLSKKETIKLGIFTNVKQGDYVEWIINVYGNERLTKWATWTANLNVDLISYWKLDESSGDAIDSHGNNDGSVTGATQGVSGKIGTAYSFDGNDYVTVPDDDTLDADSITVLAWVKGSAQDNKPVVSHYDTTNDDRAFDMAASAISNTKFKVVITDDGGWNVGHKKDYTSSTVAFDNSWHLIGFTFDNGNLSLYNDGVLDTNPTKSDDDAITSIYTSSAPVGIGVNYAGGSTNRFFTGTIDEVAIWNRSLSSEEIEYIYNGGDGMTYINLELSDITVELIAPPNNYITTNQTIEFQGNFSATNANFTNTTLYIWNSDGSVFGTNESGINPAINSSNLTISELVILSNYEWNFYTCGENATGSLCEFATENRSFKLIPYTENSQNYSTNTIEGNLETFIINITVVPGFRVETADLVYNNTAYPGTFVSSNDEYIIQRQIVIPNVDFTTNYTFYWQITMEGEDALNSTKHNQTVYNITIDDCTTNIYTLYNITILDEKEQTEINETAYNLTAEVNLHLYDITKSSEVENYSGSFNQTNPFSICINNNLSNGVSYSLDAQIFYGGDGYAEEYYHIQNSTITEDDFPTSINLYDLDDSHSQVYLITYKDENLLAVENALIQIQRKYVDEGIFKTVEIPKTDYNGETVAHLESNNALYTLIILKDGQVLATFDKVIAKCQTPALKECKINLNSFSSQVEPSDFTSLDDFTFTSDYNKDTRTITVVFSIPSGTPSTILLNTTKYDSLGIEQVCSDKLTSSSGTLTCTVPSSFGNGSIISKLEKDGELIAQAFISMEQDPSDIYGGNIVLLSLFLFLTLIGIGISNNPMITGFFLIFGAIMGVALNLVGTGSSSFIGAGATILWLIIAIIIIIIKGTNRT